MTWPHHKDAHEGAGFRDGSGEWGALSVEDVDTDTGCQDAGCRSLGL